MTTIRRRFTPEDRARSAYHYVDIEVAAGAGGLTVMLDYDATSAVLDLGLVGPDRFGGWSGSERRRVSVTPRWATPGYVPGPVGGRWQVMLGLHRLPAAGLDVAVDVDVGDVEPPVALPLPVVPSRPPRRRVPAAPGRTWVAVDLHSHTVHSDGGLDIVELAVLAAARGLDALAVTDHNTVSHHAHLVAAGAHAGIHLIPCQEVTTDRGHANCFGNIGWIDFRRPADVWLATTSARGGIMAVNHPWRKGLAWRLPLDGPAQLVEKWHWTWDRMDHMPLTDWFRFGRVGVGGSDFHRLEQGRLPGSPTTWVEVDEVTTAAILDALADGRVAISAERDGPLVVPHGGDVVVLDGAGCTIETSDGPNAVAPRRPRDCACGVGPGPWRREGRRDVLTAAAPSPAPGVRRVRRLTQVMSV